jgi:serine kinase of HPr protein (carbohydrate metabolism regulator)
VKKGDPPTSLAVQAVCARWLGRGLLIRGRPASGKSDLLVRLLEAGADLVADDLVRLEPRDGRLVARPVAHTGSIELRGQGLYHLPALAAQPLDLVVDCRQRLAERLPVERRASFLGVALPRLGLVCREASALARLRTVLLARPYGGTA